MIQLVIHDHKARVREEDGPDLMYKYAACSIIGLLRCVPMNLLHEDVRITCILDAFYTLFVLIHAWEA